MSDKPPSASTQSEPEITASSSATPETTMQERLESQLALLKKEVARRRQAEATLQQRTALVELLQQITAAANQSDTIKEALQIALDAICRYTGWPVGHIYRRAPDNPDQIIPSTVWHCRDDRFEAFRRVITTITFAAGEGWLGRVFASGEAAWISDIAADPVFIRSRPLKELGLRSGFAFPVWVGSEVTAVIELFSPDKTEPDQDLLDAMARGGVQLGYVIERVQTRKALERSQALLADAERLARLGSWEWDVTNDTVIWSDELHRIYGLPTGEFDSSYDDFLARVHPDDQKRVARLIQNAYEKRIPFRFHHRIIRPDGDVRTLLAHGKPELNKAGELVRMFGAGQDVTEQQKVEDRLAHHAQQLTALNEMGQLITMTFDLPTVFANVLEKLLPLLGASGVFILLLEGDDLRFAASNETGEHSSLEGYRVPATSGVAGEVLRTRRAQGLYGQEAKQQVFHQISDISGYRPQGLLVAPLLLHGEPIGVMEAIHPEAEAFDAEDLRLLETAAAWTAIAIGNARLFTGEQKARQVAEMLRNANLQLTQSLKLPAVLANLLDHLGKLIVCDFSSVKLIEGGYLVVHLVRGRQQYQSHYKLTQLPDDHPLRRIIASGESLLINDTAVWPDWDDALGPPDTIRSWLGVPLLAGGDLIGIYTAGSAAPGFFRERHYLRAEALASQAAIAIQNARLYSQIRRSRQRLRYLTRQVVTAQEAERRRVSRELHDEAGQALTALKISLDMIRNTLPAEQADNREKLAEVIALTDKTMTQIRHLAHDLRPPVLDTFGLNPALEGFCEEFARRTDLSIDYHGMADLPPLPETADIAFYRFLQEALNNAAKHAAADTIQVVLQQSEAMLCLQVQDDGQGFAVAEVLSATGEQGAGLIGMQERFELLGGRVDIDSTPGAGTKITACLSCSSDLGSVRE